MNPPEIDKVTQRLTFSFKKYVILALAIEGALFFFVVWAIKHFPEPEFWTKYLQLAIGVRFFFLLVVASSTINVYKIKGVDMYYKTLTHFSYYTSLGLWLLIGFLSLYFFYWWIVWVDLFYIIQNKMEFEKYYIIIVLDLSVAFEHWLSYYIVYKLGVVKQFKFHFPFGRNKIREFTE